MSIHTEELVAGRELDALVAEKVMGAKVSPCVAGHEAGFNDTDYVIGGETKHDPEPYSTDIAAAWEVFEKVGEEWLLGFSEKWGACIYIEGQRGNGLITVASASTAPLAICRAALAAVSS